MIKKVPLLTLRPVPPSFNTLTERLEEFGFKYQVAMNESQVDDFLRVSDGSNQIPEIAILPLPSTKPTQAFYDWIKVFQNKCPEIEIIALFSGKLKYPLAKILQTGVSRAFMTPFEDDYFLNRLFEIYQMEYDLSDLSFEHLHRVSVFEFEEATRVPFNIYLYLPFNKKVILYLREDQVMDAKTQAKFKSNLNYSMYINRADIQKYLVHTSEVLQSSTKQSTETNDINSNIHPSENQESSRFSSAKLAENLSYLMKGFFAEDFLENEGIDLLENFKSLTSEFVGKVSSDRQLVKNYQKLAYKKMTHQSHAANVAAYCCLFGSLAEIQDLESLQLGGLLHDIGLADLPDEILGRPFESLDSEEKNTYILHPGNGKYTVENSIPKANSDILSMVLYHHEQPNGDGYPYHLTSDQIPPVAKVCAMADEFDKLTSVRSGYRQLTPRQAILRFSGRDGEDPSPRYDINFHGPIVDKFLDQLQTMESMHEAPKPTHDEINHPKTKGLGQISVSENTKSAVNSPAQATVTSSKSGPPTIRKHLEESKLLLAQGKPYNDLNTEVRATLDQLAKDISDHFAGFT